MELDNDGEGVVVVEMELEAVEVYEGLSVNIAEEVMEVEVEGVEEGEKDSVGVRVEVQEATGKADPGGQLERQAQGTEEPVPGQ